MVKKKKYNKVCFILPSPSPDLKSLLSRLSVFIRGMISGIGLCVANAVWSAMATTCPRAFYIQIIYFGNV